MTFPQAELDFMEKGLKCSLPPPTQSQALDSLVADLAPRLTGKAVVDHVAEHLKNSPIPVLPMEDRKVINSIKKKMCENNVIVCRADKGNTLVMIDRNVYKQKVEDTLQTCGATIDPEFNFKSHVDEVRKLINGIKVVVKKVPAIKSILEPNPIPPRLYGMPKLHKPGVPMRPVVSFIGAPSYKLAKFVDRWIKAMVDVTSAYSVPNSVSLCESIRDIPTPPPNSVLVSFDVTSLFPKIPTKVTIDYIRQMLNNTLSPCPAVYEIVQLLSKCIKYNFCKFNDNYYKFPEGVGVPIGFPLGSLMGEAFLKKFEEDLFNSMYGGLEHIVYWRRYVDDVLCLWSGPIGALNDFLNHLNTLYPTIKFTMEVGGNCINFLDLTISLCDNRHTFSIYRKSTTTDTLIPGDSFTPYSYKLSAFASMAHRLVSISVSDIAYRHEISVMKYLAKLNNVHVDIEKLVHKKATKRALDGTSSLPRDTTSRRDPKWVRVPYLGKTSLDLSKFLKVAGLRPVYYSLNTVKNNFATI